MSLSLPTNPTFDPSLKHFSDEAIADYIYTKHGDDDKIRIDVDSYITLVDSIITNADRITVTVTQGIKGPFEFSDDLLKVNAVDPPLYCTLHQISSELACKGPGIEKAHQTTLDVLDILINIPWEARAVLTLTAFATEYGDIWHLNHYHSLLDPLAKSLAKIKRVPLLNKQLNSIKYRQVLLSPNSLIYSCLQAIKYVNQLKKFSKYDVKDFSELSSLLRQIVPLVSYWVIHITVAARIEISSYLNQTEGQTQKYLNELSEKISSILNTLENHLNIIREQQAQFSVKKFIR